MTITDNLKEGDIIKVRVEDDEIVPMAYVQEFETNLILAAAQYMGVVIVNKDNIVAEEGSDYAATY
jgi:hypothetical protein